MAFTARVKEILSWYPSDSPGVKTNLSRLLNTGKLAGTGKLVILPVDQGFEHGPDRSFGPNPPAYDPDYHYQLAVEAGCNAYAAPLGFLEASAGNFGGEIPLILKLNNSDLLEEVEPRSAITSSVKDAVRLGCTAVGYTIYPGSKERNGTFQDLRDIIREAKEYGLPTVLWAYPRGSGIPKTSEQAVDVIAYAAQISAQMGAHIIKVKPPNSTVHTKEAKAVYEKAGTKLETLADRVRVVTRAAFNGHRIVIFSGGEAKDTASVLEDVKQIAAGGGFGSIMGRNSFQRPKADAIQLLSQVMEAFASK
jgi:class I fructose-bisphosphate aldolase